MSELTPITRDGAINLIRDLKGDIEEKLAILAHMMLHERWDTQAQQARIAQLETDLSEQHREWQAHSDVLAEQRDEAYRQIHVLEDKLDKATNSRDWLNEYADAVINNMLKHDELPTPARNRIPPPDVIRELRVELYEHMGARARYQRMAESVVRFLESGNLALAKAQAQALVRATKEKENGTDEGTVDTD